MANRGAPSASTRSERIPPHSEEAECGVLGSALLDATRVLDLCIERHLGPASFYIPAHQALYEILLDMLQEGRPIDVLTVGDRLRDRKRLDMVGGRDYLDRLVDSTPTAAHADYYIDVVAQKYILRCIIDRARQAIDDCYQSEDDANLLLGKTEQAFFDITQQQRSALPSWDRLVRGVMEEVEHIAQTQRGLVGLPSGYRDIDDCLLGFKPGEMVILAARPGVGKTALALNIAENMALGLGDPEHKRRPVAVFSLEMSSEQLVRRMLFSRARVASQTVLRGIVTDVNHRLLAEAASQLMKAPILIDDSPGLEALELRARARRLLRRHQVELIIVDYLQLLTFPQYRREGRQQEVSSISAHMKAMAKELHVPVLVLSQLNRAPEERGGEPRLADLRESGSIEQDADVVMLLHRPKEHDNSPEADKTLARIKVAKNRNGPTLSLDMTFLSEYTRFEDRARGVDREPPFGAAEGEIP